MRPVEIVFPVPADRAFAYLADPRNRPQWQSSLRAVADVRREGAAWTDVTVVPGVRPRMRTTISEPPYRWAEEGVFGPFRARLELRFAPGSEATCVVSADFAVHGLGLGRAIAASARSAVAADLRRAALVLRPA
ncbi:SRPBCC family protein [Nocardioides daeguensis]|uniref:SRPBCC family protein n=1 Tax=Nocardioides daeguensis TaxID=908359 RepID=A0ABP6VA20_9ACTN|nr:SRPBCC family protein [Nocardioides daeguensis]MBV6726283.1 SRPBCC family protein [Nocardioides daeguensis]MCR1772126.1 SRPBCC family protein [Nocardioides daeguensis]